MSEKTLPRQPTGDRPRAASGPEARPELLAGRYEVQEKLGEGGFAVTFRGLDRESGRACVIKELLVKKVEDVKTLDLFEREARVLRNLDHPRIPRFVDFLTADDESGTRLFLVQDYVPGRSLAELIRDGKHFTEKEAIQLALGVIRILEYLHDLRPPIVHRDIKPGNIIVGVDGEPFLVDFGAVRDRVLHELMIEPGGPTVIGTYGYMPFEQYQGQAVPATDVYALGATLIFLLSHKDPGDIVAEGGRLAFERDVQVSKPLAAVLRKMTEPRVERRYQSVGEVRRDLQGILEGRARLTVTPRPAVAWALGLGALALAALVWWGQRAPAPSALVPPPASQTSERAAAPPPVAPERAPVAGYAVQGRILFDGKPVESLTDLEPAFWFRNEKEGTVQAAAASYERGRFTVTGLPKGEFGMSVQVDLEPANPISYPGDLRAWTPFNVGGGAPSSITVEMLKLLHLTKPEDNGKALPRWGEPCEGKATHAGPVLFQWDPVAEGAMYDYSIVRVTCPYASQEAVAQGSVSATSVSVALPPSQNGQFYLLNLYARRQGRRMGMLITHGASGYGWDYRFRVK